MLHGKHLIAGQWVCAPETFENMPVDGPPNSFAVGTPEHVNMAVKAAEAAFAAFSRSSRQDRAALLREIADEIDARGDAITAMGMKETGLPEARLIGERGRTTGQLKLFADHIEQGDYLDRRYDEALPKRLPLPRPDMRLMQLPVGPIGVFGASNFPLAFSVAGGDTASALAAGCPVVVKGHPAHPGVGELVAQAIATAVKECGFDAGVFSLLQGSDRAVGEALVKHPLICAIGFTGSLRGGRALYDLCCARPDPIPFFGELGSINPIFVLPHALANRGADIGADWAASLTMGAGQFCTNPGVSVIVDGPEAQLFVEAVQGALEAVPSQTMLTPAIAEAFQSGKDMVASQEGVEQRVAMGCSERSASAFLYEVSGDDWLSNQALAEEVFGPLGLVVRVKNVDQIIAVASALRGQLTATLHIDDDDAEVGRSLVPILSRKAGRLLANGFPTGVEVSDAMVHGGPYPASTNFGATSVGTMAIRRWLSPVCFQNIPRSLLPEDLQ